MKMVPADIEPFDRKLHSDNGLKDAYLELGGKEDSDDGFTWGQQAPKALCTLYAVVSSIIVGKCCNPRITEMKTRLSGNKNKTCTRTCPDPSCIISCNETAT